MVTIIYGTFIILSHSTLTNSGLRWGKVELKSQEVDRKLYLGNDVTFSLGPKQGTKFMQLLSGLLCDGCGNLLSKAVNKMATNQNGFTSFSSTAVFTLFACRGLIF